MNDPLCCMKIFWMGGETVQSQPSEFKQPTAMVGVSV